MNEVQLPTYEEIARDERQLGVLETPFEESLFVVGPPGSGKTVLAVQRAQMLADAGNSAVLITFNRMLRRLIAQLTEGQVQARTMHSFVSERYLDQVGARAPETARYVYDWNAMFETLESRGVTPGPMHVIVDEGQDLPSSLFRYLREFVATTVTVFADEDQALRADRSTLRDIKAAGRFGDPILLSANHRNTPEIARVAEFFHAGDAPVPEVKRRRSGELPRVAAYRMESATELIANWYSTRGGRVGVAVVRNPTGKEVCSRLRDRLSGQRVQSYTNEMKNEDEIDLLAPGITILNVDSIKGQEFDTVFVMEIGVLLRRASAVNNRKMYMICARARDNLFLMHEGDHLPAALLERLPGADILERP
ncbi:MAG: AAA family ATPase [Rhodospirillaceae bacterium]|nr:AAA family ATPase [Rhodospirillaceae bacterium]